MTLGASKFIIKDLRKTEEILNDYERMTGQFFEPSIDSCGVCDNLHDNWNAMLKKANEYLTVYIALEKRTSRMHRMYAKKKGRR